MKKRKLKKLLKRIEQQRLRRRHIWICKLHDALSEHGAYIR